MIFRPVITEKSLGKAASENIYMFVVDPAMSKPQIAERIAELYNVEVEWVRTAIRKAKARRTGRRRLPGMKTRAKKAYVRIKDGQTIALFDFNTQAAA
jgi:large subunit ribosomal protein L23